MAQYIDKDALVAEIEKQKQLIFPKNTGEMKVADVPKPLEQGWLNALSWIKKTINTLEVKEVDLDFQRFAKEMDAIFALPSSETKNTEENPLNWEYAIAKHFFELGLKAQKEE